MKNNVIKLSFLLFLTAVAVLFFRLGRWCGSRMRSIIHVPEKVVVRDTIRPEIPEPEIIVREVPADIDTAAILADYFAERRYRDTIIERPYLKVELEDVVSRNAVIDRRVMVDYRHQVTPLHTVTAGVLAGRNSCMVLAGYRHKSWELRAGYNWCGKSVIVGISKDVWAW